MNEILKINGLNKNFNNVEVLKDISLDVKECEILTILGESGCGKSTLLRIIANLESKDSGHITLYNNCGVAMMFQNYALFPHLNVYQNIEFALSKMPKNKRELIINELLQKFKITAIKDKMCDQISGGQAQRVAFARAVANKEKLLLLDEPFANLDYNLRNTLRTELKELIKQNGLSAIMVTHDKHDAFLLSDRIALIRNGKIIAVNTPKNLYFRPQNHDVALFLGDINLIDKEKLQNLDENFKTWLENRNFMFRPEEIISGDRYEANVLRCEFLGAFSELYLEFNGIKFKAIVNLNSDIKNTYKFDLV